MVSRIFDAPRETVFRLMNDSLYIPKWWGPRRLTTTIDKMDFRNGGFWRFVQHDADGNEYAFHGEYYEIVRPERVDMTFEFEGMPGKVSFESISFEELNGKTLVSEKSVFETVEDRDEMLATGAEEGSIESMDRIAELLENPTENAMVCDELECFVET
ncbi:MAG TPA: SRPBCC family protein [Candidatus Lokiarchaeia archaeon]|nr:SRPBCC family protein [Candidatus Lokiarchaeia archaeon]